MNFGILNSVEKNDEYFRNALLETLKSKGDTLILGYGYYSNAIFYPEKDFENKFFENLVEGFTDYANQPSKEEHIIPRIIIVGHMEKDEKNNEKKYINNFKDYEILGYRIYHRLKKEGIDADVRVVKISEKYHKKVAFKFYREKKDYVDSRYSISNLCPVMLLTGSSNLTRQGIHLGDIFNQEVDILFWNNYIIKDDKLIIKYIQKNNNFLKEENINNNIYKNFIKELKRNIKIATKHKEEKDNAEDNKPLEISKGVSLEVYIYIASLIHELKDEFNESEKSENIKELSDLQKLLIDFYDGCMESHSSDKNLERLYRNKDNYIKLVVDNNLSDIINKLEKKETDQERYTKEALEKNKDYESHKSYKGKNSYEILNEISKNSTDDNDIKEKLSELAEWANINLKK